MSNDLLRDLQKLSGAIDRHKGNGPQPSTNFRPHSYQLSPFAQMNPSYQSPPVKQRTFHPSTIQIQRLPRPYTADSKDVTIGGVEFKASKNKLTRKDASTSTQSSSQSLPRPQVRTSWATRSVPSKPFYTSRRGGYKPRGARNRVLKNTERQTKIRKLSKQCPFFTKTGACARGKKCPYQHDPEKIAICSRFLHNDCPFTAETCQLSHDPTPNRTPLCIHFANSGRCKNGDRCVYPHFKVGPRTGVCRDFAVLGYCDKGIDCDKQHLKECPSFVENGVCNIKNCKLPHVIRANLTRKKKLAETTVSGESKPTRYGISFTTMAPEETLGGGNPQVTLESKSESQGDADYIPLTFEESDDESEFSELETENSGEGDESGGIVDEEVDVALPE